MSTTLPLENSVALWVAEQVSGRSCTEGIEAFQRVFEDIWNRSSGPLGEITLTAVFDRAAHLVNRGLPAQSRLALTTDSRGFRWDEIVLPSESDVQRDLLAGLEDILRELVRILDVISGGIMTTAINQVLLESYEMDPLADASSDEESKQ